MYSSLFDIRSLYEFDFILVASSFYIFDSKNSNYLDNVDIVFGKLLFFDFLFFFDGKKEPKKPPTEMMKAKAT